MQNAQNMVMFWGALVGTMLSLTSAQQERPVNGLNHVGIVVENYEEALAFYTRTMGLEEAYTIRRPDGSPLLTYLQLSRDTFLELIPAGPNQQPGITHFGIEVGDLDATVARLREQGVEAPNPGRTPANALSSRIRDVDGVEIEVMEFGPEALQRQAMEAWK